MFSQKKRTALIASLFMATLALSVGVGAQVNPYSAPTLSLSAISGSTGSSLIISGIGFSAHVTVTVVSNTLVLSGTSSATTDSNGFFAITMTVTSGDPGDNTIVATGSDQGTHPGDTASAVFTLTNVQSLTSGETSFTGASDSTVNVVTTNSQDSTSTTGVSGSGDLGLTVTSLTQPSSGISDTGVGTVYVDVHLAVGGGATVSATSTTTVCLTVTGVTTSYTMVFWSGSAWVSATAVTVANGKICGTIPTSDLTGTNIAVYNPSATSTTTASSSSTATSSASSSSSATTSSTATQSSSTQSSSATSHTSSSSTQTSSSAQSTSSSSSSSGVGNSTLLYLGGFVVALVVIIIAALVLTRRRGGAAATS